MKQEFENVHVAKLFSEEKSNFSLYSLYLIVG